MDLKLQKSAVEKNLGYEVELGSSIIPALKKIEKNDFKPNVKFEKFFDDEPHIVLERFFNDYFN